MMEVKRIAKRMTPLCFLPSGVLVCYKEGTIYLFENDIIINKISILNNFKESFIGKFSLLNRLFRLGVRTAIAVDNNTIILSLGRSIYELDLHTKELSSGVFLGTGIRPLKFCNIADLGNFKDGIYFGGYLPNNMDKNKVSIYRRIEKDNWEIIYTFNKGTINHIHQLVPDYHRKCVWILTGDFDNAAAIWKSTDDFKSVQCLLNGKQDYRGCVAFALPEGLIYATDSPYKKNYVYLLNSDNNIEKISEIPGSCIYGCKCNEKIVFATTVEPDGRDQTILRLLFDYRRGSGILNRYSYLYGGKYPDIKNEYYKEKKDIYPFIFQFGTFKFPEGINNTTSLYFQPVGLMKNDQSLMKLSL